MNVKSQEPRAKSRTMRCLAISLAMVLPNAICVHAQCYIDPVTGERVCAQPPESGDRAPALGSRPSTFDASAHCRIQVADGSTGSGTLIAVDESLGMVLTCAHLFDQSADRIVVNFPNGTRFAARLIDRDRAHDLAALSIRRPIVEPLIVSDAQPDSELTACGFGPNGQFRCIAGSVTGQAAAAGAIHPAITLAGAVRPGDSGGGVLNPRGEVVGVVWGQRDGITYTTCGRPVRDFLDRLRGQQYVPNFAPSNSSIANPQSPAPSPQLDLQAWTREFESQLRALDAKKQDKGDYLQANALNGYVRASDAPRFDPEQFAPRSELESRIKTLASRFELVTSRVESIRQHVEQVASVKGGFFQGLSFGKVLVGALGLSGPLAAAVIVAGGLAGRHLKRGQPRSNDRLAATRSDIAGERVSEPIAVDSPPPPQRTFPETHYVSVEKDSFAKAHQWASEHVARKYPGATEILQAQDSLIKQYLAAK